VWHADSYALTQAWSHTFVSIKIVDTMANTVLVASLFQPSSHHSILDLFLSPSSQAEAI